jgi:hypothetical protein
MDQQGVCHPFNTFWDSKYKVTFSACYVFGRVFFIAVGLVKTLDNHPKMG